MSKEHFMTSCVLFNGIRDESEHICTKLTNPNKFVRSFIVLISPRTFELVSCITMESSNDDIVNLISDDEDVINLESDEEDVINIDSDEEEMIFGVATSNRFDLVKVIKKIIKDFK